MKHVPKKIVIVLALAAAGFYAAWLHLRSTLAGAGDLSDGAQRYASADAERIRYAVWDEPRAVSGEANTAAHESRPALSPDGRFLVFAVGTRGLNVDLYLAEIAGDRVSGSQPIASLASGADEIAPAFADGALWFASDRSGGAGGLDLYRAAYSDGSFGEPVRLGPGVNGAADDTDPAPRADERALVFASNRQGGRFDLFVAAESSVADGPHGARPPAALDALNSSADERDPAFAADGQKLYFASDRGGAVKGFDLFESRLHEDRWLAPAPLARLNGPADERGPAPSADGFALWFERSQGAGAGDLFRARSLELYRLPSLPIGWVDYAVLAALLALALLAWLAQRWPAIDLLYKCFLVSVIAHLLLLWWFRDVWLESGPDVRGPPERHRVRLLRDVLAHERERDGELETARASDDTGAELARARLDLAQLAADGDRPAVAGIELAPPERDLDAPARGPSALAPATLGVRAAVDLAAPVEAIERRTGSAPELAVRPEDTGSVARAEVASASPERAQPERRADAQRPSASGGTVALPVSEPLQSPARSAVAGTLVAEGALVAAAESAPIPVAEPDDARESRRGSDAPAPGFAIVPSVVAHGRATAVREPERAAGGAPQRRASSPALERGPSGAVVVAPDGADGARAPARSTGAGTLVAEGAREASAESGPIAVAQPAEARQAQSGRDTPAPGFALEPAPVASGRPPPVGGPERSAGGASRATSSSPAEESGPSGAVVGAPQGVNTACAPARSTVAGPLVAAVGGGSLEGGPIAVAQPNDARAAGSGPDAPAPGFALEPSVVASGRAPSVDEPERAAGGVPRGSASSPAEESGPSGAVVGAPRGEDVVRAPARAAGHAPGPDAGPTRSPSVVLADRELSDPRLGEPDGSGGDGGQASDFLGSLVGGASAPARNVVAAPAPERWQPDVQPLRERETAPAAAPIAASAPIEREPLVRERQRWEHTPYQNRAGEEKARALELFGGSAATEAAVERGLAYLARIQRPRGHWGRTDARDDKYGQIAVGKTGLCLLAFLGAGHTQSSGTTYSDNVARAVAYLIEVQDDARGHFGDSEAYGHGIATFALAECLALSSDPALRAPLERAVAHILAEQSRRKDARHLGGWSYYYNDERVFDRWPRTSITAWQVMALESARLSGIAVEDRAFADARAFLHGAIDEEHAFVRYNHDPERLGSGYPTLPASTPAGLFALSLLGDDITAPEYADLREFVSERAPHGYRYTSDDDFVHRATGNLYFWYYGTLALFRAGGTEWQRWNEALKSTLLPAQQEDGSWKPIDAYARYARDSAEDQSYTTAMCVLSLEIYYRYFLPLLRVK